MKRTMTEEEAMEPHKPTDEEARETKEYFEALGDPALSKSQEKRPAIQQGIPEAAWTEFVKNHQYMDPDAGHRTAFMAGCKVLEAERDRYKDMIGEDLKNEFLTRFMGLEFLGERITTLEATLQLILNWAKAYPLKIFPEPDMKKAHEALKTVGITLDAVSASNMRHVITRLMEECALAQTEETLNGTH